MRLLNILAAVALLTCSAFAANNHDPFNGDRLVSGSLTVTAMDSLVGQAWERVDAQTIYEYAPLSSTVRLRAKNNGAASVQINATGIARDSSWVTATATLAASDDSTTLYYYQGIGQNAALDSVFQAVEHLWLDDNSSGTVQVWASGGTYSVGNHVSTIAAGQLWQPTAHILTGNHDKVILDEMVLAVPASSGAVQVEVRFYPEVLDIRTPTAYERAGFGYIDPAVNTEPVVVPIRRTLNGVGAIEVWAKGASDPDAIAVTLMYRRIK